jgi:hypothetical protein
LLGVLSQVNAQALWGLSSALQLECATEALTFAEVRLPPGTTHMMSPPNGPARAVKAHARMLATTGAPRASLAQVRVELDIDRPDEARKADPRPSPLSHDLGAIVAGIAAGPAGAAKGLHTIAELADVAALRERFPAMDEPYND